MQRTNLSTSSSNKATGLVPGLDESNGSGHITTAGNNPVQDSGSVHFRKFLAGVLLPVFAVLFIAGFIFNFFFENKIILGSEVNGGYKVNRALNIYDPNEIPIFGASRAQSGFIPDSLGKNFFNYGMDGTSSDVLLMMLEAECKKKNKLNPLIIANIDLEGFRYMTGDICNYLYNSREQPIKQLLGNEFKTYYTIPFLKYYSQYEMYTKYYLNEKMQLTKFSNKGSYIEKNALTKQKFDDMVEQRRTWVTTFMIDTVMSPRLLGLIKAHPERTFVFVVSPYHQSYFEKFSNLPEARSYLSTLSAYKNVKVFDFSNIVYPDEYFVNTTHLNLNGALAFSKTFRDSLHTAFPAILTN